MQKHELDDIQKSFIDSCRTVRDLTKALRNAENTKKELKLILEENNCLGMAELESLWWDERN